MRLNNRHMYLYYEDTTHNFEWFSEYASLIEYDTVRNYGIYGRPGILYSRPNSVRPHIWQ